MSVYRLFKFAIRALGVYALCKSLLNISIFIGTMAIFSSVPSSAEGLGFILTSSFVSFITFALPMVLGLLALFRTDRVLIFLGIQPDDVKPIRFKNRESVMMVVVLIGTIFIVSGGNSAFEWTYNYNYNYNYQMNMEETQAAGEPKYDRTKTSDTFNVGHNFDPFSMLMIIAGIIIMFNRNTISDKILSRSKPDSTQLTSEE